MADIKTAYGTPTTLTVTGVASLATSSTLLAGYETSIIDNTTDKMLDALIDGTIFAGTSPSAGYIEINLIGVRGDDTWPDVFDGTASAETITSANVKAGICKQVISMFTDTTSDQGYPFGPFAVASFFGDKMPKKVVAFVTHSTGVNLKSSGHVINVLPLYMTST